MLVMVTYNIVIRQNKFFIIIIFYFSCRPTFCCFNMLLFNITELSAQFAVGLSLGFGRIKLGKIIKNKDNNII